MIRLGDSYPLPGTVRVTWWLLAINVLSYMATRSFPVLLEAGGVVPLQFTNPDGLDPTLLDLKPPGLVTIIWYTFLHADLMHLLSNAFYLFILGPNLERYMGKGRFILFYFSCGSVGALAHVLLFPSSAIPVVGASGAIFGTYGAYLALFPKNYIRISFGNRRNYRDIMLPVLIFLALWLPFELLNILFGTHIAYAAHIGGFICGFLLSGTRFKFTPGKQKFRVFTGGEAG
jgi:membrane associated rhomboid family serine protease